MESFLRADVDLAYVTKVAVVPFENNSKDQFAAERIRGLAITQILAQGLFDVVDRGLVDSALREEAIDLNKAPMDAATMKQLGQRLVVQAFLLGSIDQAGGVQRGNSSFPELSVTLRLVDSNTGMIFWQASGNRTGDSMGKRLFGFSSDDDFKIALNLLKQLLATISADHKVKLPVPAPAPEAVQHIAPQDGNASQGGGAAAEHIAPEEPGEADDLSVQPGSDASPAGEEQAVPMGLDESLTQDAPPAEPGVDDQPEAGQEVQTPDQAAPEAPEAPSALPEPVATPADQIGEQGAPLEEEKPEPALPPAQDSISEPSVPPEPVEMPQPGGVQEWPE